MRTNRMDTYLRAMRGHSAKALDDSCETLDRLTAAEQRDARMAAAPPPEIPEGFTPTVQALSEQQVDMSAEQATDMEDQ